MAKSQVCKPDLDTCSIQSKASVYRWCETWGVFYIPGPQMNDGQLLPFRGQTIEAFAVSAMVIPCSFAEWMAQKNLNFIFTTKMGLPKKFKAHELRK